MYDICDNQHDLYYLESVETNSLVNNELLALKHPEIFCGDNGPKRSINDEDFEEEVLELYQKGAIIVVNKQDVIALAKHFDLMDIS